MTTNAQALAALAPHLTSRIRNYAVPDLTSRLLEGWTPRVFTVEGYQHTAFTLPHSHRYNLLSIVLAGHVYNRIWFKYRGRGIDPGDRHCTRLTYAGEPGKYATAPESYEQWACRGACYRWGEAYYMAHTDVHSIQFSPDACVLILESPPVSDSSIVLHREPRFVVDPGLFVRDDPTPREPGTPDRCPYCGGRWHTGRCDY